MIADRLREKAKRERACAAFVTPADVGILAADRLDLLADCYEALGAAPHDPGCSGEWGYRCKCGRAELRARIEEVARSQARDARRRLAAAPSSVEALELAAISSSPDPAERRAMYRTLHALAVCESRVDHTARNRVAEARSGEHATGLLQFLPSTWSSTPYARLSIWSPHAQALAGAWMIQQGRLDEWACAWSTR